MICLSDYFRLGGGVEESGRRKGQQDQTDAGQNEERAGGCQEIGEWAMIAEGHWGRATTSIQMLVNTKKELADAKRLVSGLGATRSNRCWSKQERAGRRQEIGEWVRGNKIKYMLVKTRKGLQTPRNW